MKPPVAPVTELLAAFCAGDRGALDRLMPLVYSELRRLARRRLRGESAHTLRTTGLVHEAYLRLIDQRQAHWQGRAQFFALAAQLMRRILLDHARARHAAKRGGGVVRVALHEAEELSTDAEAAELVRLDEALGRLAALDPEQGRIVELRYFGGLTVEETAAVLGASPATIKREWSHARAWLSREIRRAA
jgi:RNA polymerase sigma-70 factor, ECF subfamily